MRNVGIGGGAPGHGFGFGPVWAEPLADLTEARVPSLALDTL
ncbi:MAG: hypothetical protein ACLQCU_01455 [Acidimicrobiales bacterium]